VLAAVAQDGRALIDAAASLRCDDAIWLAAAESRRRAGEEDY